MHLLVVEDERKIAQFIRKGLAECGILTTAASDGDEGLALARSHEFDAIILDVMLPGRDGLSLLRALRESKNPVPVLLLTARASVSDRVEGLNSGADDYLPKPFAMDELIARVRALVRRSSGEKLTNYRVADVVLNLATREVHRGGRKIDLTTREFSLLEYLMRGAGQVLTRTQICERVWDYHFDPGTNLVDVYIQRIRKKLEDSDPPKLIQTIRGVGYTMKDA